MIVEYRIGRIYKTLTKRNNMKSQSKWEQFIDKLKSLPQLLCKHDYVFSTMDELKQLNWDRISGSINCPKCGHYSNIYIPKDDE